MHLHSDNLPPANHNVGVSALGTEKELAEKEFSSGRALLLETSHGPPCNKYIIVPKEGVRLVPDPQSPLLMPVARQSKQAAGGAQVRPCRISISPAAASGLFSTLQPHG